VEEDGFDEIDEDDNNIEIQSDPGMPLKPKGKKREGREGTEWREMRKRNLTNPSI
jgi:hypothetical protein